MANLEEQLKELTTAVASMSAAFQALNTRVNEMEQNPSSSMVRNMGKMVQKLNDGAAYHESSNYDSSLSSKLPEKFSANDLPKFKPTDDPLFPLSLEPICQKWFFSLPEKDTATWEDIAHAFMTRYKGNIQVQTSSRELEILKQEEKEGFTAFLTRWRQVAAQMVNTPPESEMVKTFIANLQPKYRNHLRYMGLETFDKVYHIGIAIEDDLLKENSKSTRWNNNNNNNKITTEKMTMLAFDRLKSKGAISPIGPTPDPAPENRSQRWDPAKYCKYHQGKGHSTEECFKLKDLLQDMVEDGRLPIPPGAKKPNTRTNPLTTLCIHVEEASFDPTALITPVGQPIPNIIISEDTFVNGLWASDDEDEYINDCSHTAHHSVAEEEEIVNEATKDDADEQDEVRVLTRSGRVSEAIPQQPVHTSPPPQPS
ncbi:Activity-regulated cytoskeleton-associated protein [Bienertia sinuspersici]